jgi:hemerythrin-like domain-containing protein
MFYEHALGRQHLRALAAAAESAASGDRNALGNFAELARGYVYAMRDHIVKEDRHLFPLANRALTADDQPALLRSFAGVNTRLAAPYDTYLRLADELADHLHVPKTHREAVEEPSCSAPGCCAAVAPAARMDAAAVLTVH